MHEHSEADYRCGGYVGVKTNMCTSQPDLSFKAMTSRIDPSEHCRTIPQFNDPLLRVHRGPAPAYTLILFGPPASYGDWREDWLESRARVRSLKETLPPDNSRRRVKLRGNVSRSEWQSFRLRSGLWDSDLAHERPAPRGHKRYREDEVPVEDRGGVVGSTRRRPRDRASGPQRVRWAAEVEVQQAAYEARAPAREASKKKKEPRKTLNKLCRKPWNELTAAEKDLYHRLIFELAFGR